MRRMLSVFVPLLFVIISLGTVKAQWSTDPTQNLPVCTADFEQMYPIIVSDDSGGAIIIWFDYRWGVDSDIFAQRIDKNGYPRWLENGMDICVNVRDQIYPRAISDGAGGAIITWWDYRNGSDYDVYAQRVNSQGERIWSPMQGIPICNLPGDQVPYSIIPDGSGGAIIVWPDRRGADYDIFAQRVNDTGQALWGINGKPICTEAGDQGSPSAVSDGAGGAIIAWYDRRSSTIDVYAQRVDGDGNLIWASGGVPICVGQTGSWYRTPVLVKDGGGGAIIVWIDGRNGDTDIYGQRVYPNGSAAWVTNGIPIYAGPGNQYIYYFFSKPLIPDGSGGAIVTWYDYRSGDADVYAQRVKGNGSLLWGAGGVPVSMGTGEQQTPSIVADGTGGGVVCWMDNRSGNFDIYAQRVNANGEMQWAANGIAICLAESDQYYPVALADGAGGAIITWGDGRNDAGDVYAQRINRNGSLDALPPQISLDPDLFLQFPDTLSSYEIICQVTDNVSVASCSLFYSSDAGTTFTPLPMISSPGDTIYSGCIPAQQTYTTVYYYISALDSVGNMTTAPQEAPDSTFGFFVVDATPPSIFYSQGFTELPDTLNSYEISCKVKDNISVASCSLFYSVNAGTTFAVSAMGSSQGDSIWTGDIPGQQTNTEVNYYFFAFDSAGNGATLPVDAPDSTFSFLVVDATPPTIAVTPLSPAPAGSAVTVSGTITDNSRVEAAWLFYRMGGKTAYDSLQMDSSGVNTYQALIPGGSVTIRGVEYYLWATDGVNSATSPPTNAKSNPYSLRVTTDKIAKSTAQPSGETVSAYRMISIPIQLDDGSPKKVLEDDLGSYDNTKWRFGRWNPQVEKYEEYPDVDNFAPGRAFWLIVKDAGKVIDAGSGTSVTTADSFSISLQPGWNQIAVPFDFPVAWNKVRATYPDSIGGNSPVSWDGSYHNRASTLQPWDGYWVENTGTQVNTIYIPPQEASGGAPAKGTPFPALVGGWWLKISVSSGDLRDGDNFLGVCPSASDRWDRHDWSEPPSLPGLLNLYFNHNDWGRRSGRYMADIRKEIGEGQTWEISVDGGAAILNLKVENIESIPRAYEVWLLALGSRRAWDLRREQECRVESSRRFQVLVGTSEYIHRTLDEFSSIPANYFLSQNYPNPFNPTTVISYQLPATGGQRSAVSLKVYNVLGQEVRTLVDEEQPPGYYSVSWDGRDSEGEEVCSGVYFYRLKAGGFTKSRRMLLLR